MKDIITVSKIRKEFKDKVALENLNFKVKEGEIFGFLGPSGAGKTTSIKMLTSQLMPTSGEAKIFDKLVHLNKRYIMDNVGILSDNSGLYERLSVWDNLKLFTKIYKVPKESILEVLDKVGLKEEANTQVKKLSRGMKQRVMIARAVIHKPKLLFLDEPTASLDPGTVLKIHQLLRELNKDGTTIFLTTHNMEEADKLCHRVAFLNEGRIVEIGEPEKLKLKYREDEIRVTLDCEEEVVRLNKNSEAANKISQWIESGSLLTIHSAEPTLEDIFLNITGRAL